MFWKTYCMIEGRLNITMKGRLHFYRKERCFTGLLYILQGYSFLEEVMHCLEGKLQLMNERSILNEGIAFAKGTLHSVGPTIKSSPWSHQITSGLQFRGLPDLYRLHHLEHWHLVVPDDPGCGRLQGPGGDPPQPETRRGAGEGQAALPGAAGGRLDRRGVLGHRGWVFWAPGAGGFWPCKTWSVQTGARRNIFWRAKHGTFLCFKSYKLYMCMYIYIYVWIYI